MKITNTDCFLKQGFKHKICEDYILSGFEPVPYVILSDGCSSSRNTDIGARILCHVAKDFFQNTTCDLHDMDITTFFKSVIIKAEVISSLLNLHRHCLDATLIISYEVDGVVYTYMTGDGIVIIDKKDTIEYHEVYFDYSMPYYLSYLLNNNDHNDYLNTKIIKRENKIIVDKESGDCIHDTTEEHDTPLNYASWTFKRSDCNSVLISSDGLTPFRFYQNTVDSKIILNDVKTHLLRGATTVQTIQDNISEKEKSLVPEGGSLKTLDKILSEVTGFKSPKGKFIRKRMKKVITNMEKRGFQHDDDISIGGFIFTEV